MNEKTNIPEPLSAILAEMRDERIVRLDDGDATRLVLRNLADRIEEAVQRFVADDCAKCAHYNAATISLKDALDLANTIANHGINANDLGDKASAAIYALCHEVRTVRREDAEIKQEVQRLRRELLNHRNAHGNAAAMRGALLKVLGCYESGAIRTEYNDPDSWKHDDELCYLKDDVEAALAAPSRNVDRFADIATAITAFSREVPDWEDHDGIPDYYELAKWLFAPAEGGAE